MIKKRRGDRGHHWRIPWEDWKNWVIELLMRMEKDAKEMQASIQHVKGQLKPTWMRIK
jgi:hypothetical protein